MHEVKPSKIKFIKLGRAGMWEEDCIDKSNTLRLGYDSVDHELALAKDWTILHLRPAVMRVLLA